jgi:hopanoid biosynthesis associated radical SAM protein HpnH
MGFSRELSTSLGKYIALKKISGKKRFPLVLMLEPSFKCNLACSGCGRIREYRDILDQSMSREECLESVEEAGAPIVSITGGEPLIHPQIEQIVNGIIARKKFVNLCTNGLLLKESLKKFKPSPYLNFVLHLDNLAETHDRFAGRQGVFDCAIEAMKAAKASGFHVLINTTIYKTTQMAEITRLFDMLKMLPVNGIMVAPAFNYEAVNNHVFMTREESITKFRALDALRRQYPFYNTPMYLDFLSGRRRLKCSPWSTPTRNPKGWKRPCYLLTDDHVKTYNELFEETDWSKYGVDNNPRCTNCMVHCGFEGSSLDKSMRDPGAFRQIVTWSLFRG